MQVQLKSDNLYKRDSKGKVRVWNYETGTDGERWAWRTNAGINEGKIVTSEWKFVEQKNVGRANETSLQEQAEFEANADFTKKQETGYFTDIDAVDTFSKFKPMLANEYVAGKVDFEDDIYSQPKLDGIRCIARADGLWTRQFKPIVSCPHIEQALAPFFKKYPDAILDGELYNHDFKDDFNKITSMVRKSKLKIDDFEESRKFVQYHVYDTFMDADFFDRYDWLFEQEFTAPIKLVQTNWVSGETRLDELYSEYLADGYEGQMVRINKEYQNKRSKYLLKRKEFITEEYGVCGVSEGQGNWSGAIKRFHLYDAHGVGFDAGVRGTYEQMKELFESGEQPDWATLRYFALTPDGIPRFPVVIDWGTGIRED